MKSQVIPIELVRPQGSDHWHGQAPEGLVVPSLTEVQMMAALVQVPGTCRYLQIDPDNQGRWVHPDEILGDLDACWAIRISNKQGRITALHLDFDFPRPVRSFEPGRDTDATKILRRLSGDPGAQSKECQALLAAADIWSVRYWTGSGYSLLTGLSGSHLARPVAAILMALGARYDSLDLLAIRDRAKCLAVRLPGIPDRQGRPSGLIDMQPAQAIQILGEQRAGIEQLSELAQLLGLSPFTGMKRGQTLVPHYYALGARHDLKPLALDLPPYVAAVLTYNCVEIIEDPTHDTIVRASAAVGNYVAGGELDYHYALQQLLAAADCGHRIRAKNYKSVIGGLHMGAKTPRRAPDHMRSTLSRTADLDAWFAAVSQGDWGRCSSMAPVLMGIRTLLETKDGGLRNAAPMALRSLALTSGVAAISVRRILALLVDRGWLKRIPEQESDEIVVSNRSGHIARPAHIYGLCWPTGEVDHSFGQFVPTPISGLLLVGQRGADLCRALTDTPRSAAEIATATGHRYRPRQVYHKLRAMARGSLAGHVVHHAGGLWSWAGTDSPHEVFAQRFQESPRHLAYCRRARRYGLDRLHAGMHRLISDDVGIDQPVREYLQRLAVSDNPYDRESAGQLDYLCQRSEPIGAADVAQGLADLHRWQTQTSLALPLVA